ncbi:hypothetical protein BH09BAC2_BH09BAC2_02940 [soil metagenome]
MIENKNLARFKNYIKTLLYKRRFRYRLNHHYKSLHFNPKKTHSNPIEDDSKLIIRLINLYKTCNENFDGNKDSMWSEIFMKLQGDIHEAFISENKDKIKDILRNPSNYNVFYGFENSCKDLLIINRLEDKLEPEMTMDGLITLCEAVGVINVSNPESLRIRSSINADKALELLEKEFGFSLNFPNPFKDEYGIETKKGILSYRAVQGIYQAWRIFKILEKTPNPAVIEIGGGLGRTAYFARQFGIKNYTIVDIPMSSLAQGNFLGRVLPEESISMMEKEDTNLDSKIKLIHPKLYYSSGVHYDLTVNVDSLTELEINIAENYLKKIIENSSYFLSINHEHNSFSVNSISDKHPNLQKLLRFPYWLRKGYVEELFNINHV